MSAERRYIVLTREETDVLHGDDEAAAQQMLRDVRRWAMEIYRGHGMTVEIDDADDVVVAVVQ